MAAGQIKRWPEWRQLYERALPLITNGTTSFTYEELDALANVDVRSDRGRSQFYKFRRELLKQHQLWLENVPAHGYTVLPAKDQPAAAYKRLKQARRKVGMAKAINSNIHFEKLTPEQRALQAATATVLHELSKTFYAVGRKFNLASKQAMVSPILDVTKLLESVDGKKPNGKA